MYILVQKGKFCIINNFEKYGLLGSLDISVYDRYGTYLLVHVQKEPPTVIKLCVTEILSDKPVTFYFKLQKSSIYRNLS